MAFVNYGNSALNKQLNTAAMKKLAAKAPPPKPAAKAKPAPKPKKQLTPQEKIRRTYEKNTKDLKSLGKKGEITTERITGAPLDTSGVDAIKNMALTPSQESAWLKMATEQQKLEEANALDSASKGAATAADTARTNLAMTGGLRSGAAERIAAAAGDQDLLARQGVRNQGALTRAGLGMNAEQNRLTALGQLPGAQLAVANYGTDIQRFNATNQNIANAANVSNRINDLANRNAMAETLYKTDMGQWAADQQAAALERNKSPGLQDQFMSNPAGRVLAGGMTMGASEFGKGGALSGVGKAVTGGGK